MMHDNSPILYQESTSNSHATISEWDRVAGTTHPVHGPGQLKNVSSVRSLKLEMVRGTPAFSGIAFGLGHPSGLPLYHRALPN